MFRFYICKVLNDFSQEAWTDFPHKLFIIGQISRI